MSTLLPGSKDLYFLPLGGTGEIGMNMNLYGHDDHWLMVDCGVTFKDTLTPDSTELFDVISADPAFITAQSDKLCGLVLTHAHEDHVGAVADLWPRLQCPVYTTRFTAEFLRRKLAQHSLLDRVPIIEVDSGATLDIGPFNVEWLPLTHSLPEPHALVIRTSAGNVFHTGDWKIDPQPVIGEPFDPTPFQALGDGSIDAMVCDSTNANRPGRSLSEGACFAGLYEQVKTTEGRVIVGCFGSNIARLITLCRIAQETGRYVGLYGRSLQTMVSTAKATGVWPADCDIIDSRHLAYLPPREVLAIATGSQGEPRTALQRMATDSHYELDISAGDRVIFSAIVIPGNETSVENLVRLLKLKKVEVVMAADCETPIHASGHPSADDVADLYRWVQPRIAIPVHGEAEHMLANANIARTSGVRKQLTGQNGDLFVISGPGRVRKNAVSTGRIALRR
ncbi:ribonuclease J [Reinekea blandensis]|uniref:Metallo-beta-lactamase family protein n=1 Tax=Reinekea blandensis MED297 TaxID=314283 RepID=A4BBE2_9GAMM|nr:ribonuclease J [Reinekea blandensis]EAR10755.1 metallo-beta-lactamase family protein [Reinekea sp. MED297] [Reinekea blandensis MED297]